MSEQLITVTFLTNTLYIVRHLDQPFVPMKPVVEAIGLAWQVQHRKLTAEQRYNHVVIPLHSPGGLQDTLCIPLHKLNGWLFSINASKVKPELRETVISFQEECFEALYEYWHHGAARRPLDEEEPEDAAGSEDLDLNALAPPAHTRFHGLDSALMRELRLLNPLLVQAYLVDHGITPNVVSGLLSRSQALPAPEDAPATVPLELLAIRIENVARHEDNHAWYLERHEWLKLCTGYDARHTALWLRDLGLLRTNGGRLTLRASPNMFNGQRPSVFCVLKTLRESVAAAGAAAESWASNQQQNKGGTAHVQ